MVLCFSVIIPCYHDEKKLASLLTQLQSLPHRPYEIIVVDGAQSKVCREICAQHHTRWLASDPCRGRQMRLGAQAAKGNVLWFLHADVGLSADPLMAMGYAISRGYVGGYYRFKFRVSSNWSARILEYAIALRCRFGIPYGDQGIFIKQPAYHQVGGHAAWPLFEEVPLIRKIRRQGRFLSLSDPIYVDPQRWIRDGWWQRTWNNRKLALQFMRGNTPVKLALQYYSDTHF